MTAVINKLKDKTGNQQLPVTHERAVRDSEGTTLETKLQNLEGAMDKAYVASSDNGMGRITLKKNMVSGVNTLTQSMMQATNTIYVIRYDFTLGEDITVPANCVLEFDGGSISGAYTITGELITANGCIDLKDVGVVYNDESSAAANGACLAILGGITNKISIKVTDNVYLGGSGTITLDNISIDGCNNIIYLKNFGGITIDGNISIENAKVISMGDSCSFLFKVPSTTKHSSVHVKNNEFSGNMVVVWSRNYASDANHYTKEVCIESNKFDEIYYHEGNTGNASRTFEFTNTNILNLAIKNNVAHNFFGIFFSYGITNDTEYEQTIYQQYKAIGRETLVEGNNAYNDLGKQWDSTMAAQTLYLCFLLIEYGDCTVRGNYFRNMLRTDQNDTVAYDNYLSAHNLTYENNVWQNCFSLHNIDKHIDSPNVIIKGKSNGGTRIYRNNKFTITDLSEYYTYTKSEVAPFWIHSEKDWDMILEGNVFDLDMLLIKSNSSKVAGNLVIKNNVWTIANAFGVSSYQALFCTYGADSCMLIKDNRFTATTTNMHIYLLESPSISSNHAKECVVDGNYCDGLGLFVGFEINDVANYRITDNVCVIYDNRRVVFDYSSNNLISHGNRVVFGEACTMNYCANGKNYPQQMNSIINASYDGIGSILYMNRTGLYTIKVKELTLGKSLTCQLFYDATAQKAYAFNSNPTYGEIGTSRTYLFSNENTNDYIQANNSAIYINYQGGNKIFEVTVSVETNVNKNCITEYPKVIASVNLPFDGIPSGSMTMLLDSGNKKPVWFNGTSWVDATGTPV